MTEAGLLERKIAGSGLIPEGTRGVVLLSGGADSVGLVWGLHRLLGPGAITALHVNYGLRADSDRDETLCRELCDRLGLELVACAAGERQGNLHDWAREVRYGEAERLADRRGLDWIAVGHTRTDLVETTLYRLAASPGTRALRAMPARRGRIVRPLLGLGRDEVRREVEEAGLAFVDDPSNLDPAFARAKIRSGVMPVLGQVNPAFERNVTRTLAELDEDAAFIEAEAGRLVERGPDGRAFITADVIAAVAPSVARRALRLLVERSAGRSIPVSIETTTLVRRLARRPEGGSADPGGGLLFEVGSGVVLAEPAAATTADDDPGRLPIPGALGWGGWLFGAGTVDPVVRSNGLSAALDRERLGESVEVRTWRPGDRVRPLGMEGTKRVVELMGEKRLPRARRAGWPVIEVGGQIAWVPGVAVSEAFRARPGGGEPVLLTAGRSRASGDGSGT